MLEYENQAACSKHSKTNQKKEECNSNDVGITFTAPLYKRLDLWVLSIVPVALCEVVFTVYISIQLIFIINSFFTAVIFWFAPVVVPFPGSCAVVFRRVVISSPVFSDIRAEILTLHLIVPFPHLQTILVSVPHSKRWSQLFFFYQKYSVHCNFSHVRHNG